MRRNSGGIESLLLLSCLVGAVSFYCMSLVVGKSLFALPEAKMKDRLQELKDLQTQILLSEGKIDSLQAVKNYLDEELSKSDRMSNRPKNTEAERLKINQNLKNIQSQLLELINERSKLIRQIELLQANLSKDSKEEKIKLLAQLRERKIELDNKIKTFEKKINTTQDDNNYDLQTLRNEYDLLQNKIQSTQAENDKLKLKLLTSGTENYTNPLYLDCKQGIASIYPERTDIAQSEISQSRIHKIIKGHDIVVLYVRPDGYDVFYALFKIMDNVDLPFCYEPLLADQKIDLLIGNK